MTNVLGVPVHDADEHWMRHALALAERAQREFADLELDAAGHQVGDQRTVFDVGVLLVLGAFLGH